MFTAGAREDLFRCKFGIHQGFSVIFNTAVGLGVCDVDYLVYSCAELK